MLKVDLHMHTNYIQKWEGKHSPKQLIDKAKCLGFDAICITEHYWPDKPENSPYRKNPLQTYNDYKEYAKKKGILLIPGVEIKIPNSGDVVLINFNDNITKIKSYDDLCKISKNTIVMAAHPYFLKMCCIGKDLVKHIDKFDAIEYSHFYIKEINKNKKAVKVAKHFNKLLIPTSDAHWTFQLNSSYILVDAKKDIKSIIKAVKKGNFKPVTKPLPYHKFFFIAFASCIGIFLKYALGIEI